MTAALLRFVAGLICDGYETGSRKTIGRSDMNGYSSDIFLSVGFQNLSRFSYGPSWITIFKCLVDVVRKYLKVCFHPSFITVFFVDTLTPLVSRCHLFTTHAGHLCESRLFACAVNPADLVGGITALFL